MMWMFSKSLFVLAVTVGAVNVDEMTTAFQNVIDTASYAAENAGISLGVAMPDHTVSLATGFKERSKQVPLQPSDKLGIGSGTKIFTAVSILKLVDQGKLKLDEPALPYMEKITKTLTGHSLVDYYGPEIRNVTVRMLAHMTSGIGDFDSKAGRRQMYEHPDAEMDIAQSLGQGQMSANAERTTFKQNVGYDNAFTCMPGECGEYSSTNYLLMGLISTQMSGAKDWRDYDQASFMPLSLRQNLKDTVFPLKGKMTEFTDVHGYLIVKDPETKKEEVHDTSTLPGNTGWVVANGMSSGRDMAVFMRALFGKDHSILSDKSRQEMIKLRWLETGYGNKVTAGQFYGMGCRDLSGQLYENIPTMWMNPEIYTAGLLIGHDGMSPAGFNAFNVYAPHHDFGFSFIFNYGKAANVFNFLANRIYQVASKYTKPVANPLKPTYENRDEFMAGGFSGLLKLMRKIRKVVPVEATV